MDAKRKIEDLPDEKLDVKKAKIEDETLIPASLPPLRRAIAPPLTHDSTLGSFTYHGSGLLKNSVPFIQDISPYIAVLTDAHTKSGRPVKRWTVPPKQTTVWWRAQCAFRGLSDAGGLATLEERLRLAQDVGMTEELRALEARLDAEYRALNAEAHDFLWKSLHTDQAKAAEHPARFIEEAYSHGKLSREAIMLKCYGVSHEEMSAAAEKLGLACEIVDDWWIVVGAFQAVSEKAKEIRDECELATARSREVQRAREQAIEDKEERIVERHAQVVKAANADPDADWDVSGTWIIDCGFLSEWCEISGESEVELDCQLAIAFESGNGGRQMWASFQFLLYRGVFRFREVEEVSADEGDNGAASSATSTSFNGRPSAAASTWEYDWHGEVGFAGCSGGDFEEQHGYITFGEPKGTTLEGVFPAVSRGEDYSFTGRKVSADIKDITGISNKTVEGTEDDTGASTRNITAQDMARKWADFDRHVQSMTGRDTSCSTDE